ncbi:MAG: hypothetical protein ACI8ZM_002387 [Crocinitomix sp.]|jgi:hypothetical protein
MMKNIFKVSAISLMTILFAASCEKEEVTPQYDDGSSITEDMFDNSDGCSDEIDLIGIWEWAQSSGGFKADTVQQEQLGYPVRLEITETSIKRFENNDLVYDTEYKIEYAEHINGYKSGVLFIEGDDLTYLVSHIGSVLYLDEQISAGYRHLYIYDY